VNLIDMLDRLEAGIAALRARATIDGADHAPKSARSRSKSKRKNKSAGGKTSKKRTQEQQLLPMQPDLPPEEGTAAPAARIIGKRQALGRSLLQLRRGHGDTPGPH